MIRNDFIKIKDFFTLYTAQFHSDDPYFQQNIDLKRNHSYRVWENTADLAQHLQCSGQEQILIETAGLLHDIGRFKQFEVYGTFSDKKSVNHAQLSVEVIRENNLLEDLDSAEQESIITAVFNHNKKEIPDDLSKRDRLFVKILRDSDKLDIWKIVTDYYCQTEGTTNNTLQLDLPDEPEINPHNIEDLLQERMVDLQNLKTLNDFKLLQIGWIYDLNFHRSYEILKEKNYLESIFDTLPETPQIKKIRNKVREYLEIKTPPQD